MRLAGGKRRRKKNPKPTLKDAVMADLKLVKLDIDWRASALAGGVIGGSSRTRLVANAVGGHGRENVDSVGNRGGGEGSGRSGGSTRSSESFQSVSDRTEISSLMGPSSGQTMTVNAGETKSGSDAHTNVLRRHSTEEDSRGRKKGRRVSVKKRIGWSPSPVAVDQRGDTCPSGRGEDSSGESKAAVVEPTPLMIGGEVSDRDLEDSVRRSKSSGDQRGKGQPTRSTSGLGSKSGRVSSTAKKRAERKAREQTREPGKLNAGGASKHILAMRAVPRLDSFHLDDAWKSDSSDDGVDESVVGITVVGGTGRGTGEGTDSGAGMGTGTDGGTGGSAGGGAGDDNGNGNDSSECDGAGYDGTGENAVVGGVSEGSAYTGHGTGASWAGHQAEGSRGDGNGDGDGDGDGDVNIDTLSRATRMGSMDFDDFDVPAHDNPMHAQGSERQQEERERERQTRESFAIFGGGGGSGGGGGGGEWQHVLDEATGHYYYYNEGTGESSWTEPSK